MEEKAVEEKYNKNEDGAVTKEVFNPEDYLKYGYDSLGKYVFNRVDRSKTLSDIFGVCSAWYSRDSIYSLNLSQPRTINWLTRYMDPPLLAPTGCHLTVDELLELRIEDLLHARNLGEKGLYEVIEKTYMFLNPNYARKCKLLELRARIVDEHVDKNLVENHKLNMSEESGVIPTYDFSDQALAKMVNEAKGNSDATLSLLSELSKVTEDEVLKEKIAHFVEEEKKEREAFYKVESDCIYAVEGWGWNGDTECFLEQKLCMLPMIAIETGKKLYGQFRVKKYKLVTAVPECAPEDYDAIGPCLYSFYFEENGNVTNEMGYKNRLML